jgi:DNA-binding FrmR family transcriptional regulator
MFMSHTIKSKSKLLTRIRRIKGQVEALESALEKENECVAILQQIAAIRGAANGLMNEVLEGHIRDHLGPNNRSHEQRETDMEHVLAVLKSYLK